MHHIALMDLPFHMMPLEIYNKESGEVLSVPINCVERSLYSNQAIKMRNTTEDFVNSEEGSVSWREEYVTRTSYDWKDLTNEHEF